MATTREVIRQRREETIARGGGAHLPQQRAWCVGGGALWMESMSSVRNAWDQSLLRCTRKMARACVHSVRSSFIAPALAVVGCYPRLMLWCTIARSTVSHVSPHRSPKMTQQL